MIAARNPLVIGLRNHGLRTVRRLPVIGAIVSEYRFKPVPRLTAGFLVGTPRKGSAVGQMIPQPLIALADGRRLPLDDALGDGLLVLGRDIDPTELMTPADAAAWAAAGARFVTLRSHLQQPAQASDLIDYLDILCPWLQARHGQVGVLRPDRFVLATDAGGLAMPLGTNVAAAVAASATGALPPSGFDPATISPPPGVRLEAAGQRSHSS